MTPVAPAALETIGNTGRRFEPVVPPFPPMVLVEVTTRCNLSCVHCPSSILTAKPEFVGDIDVALYRRVVDEIAGHPGTLFRPFNGGEPMLRRDLPDLVRYAKAKGIRWVGVTSNGTLLVDRMRRALIDAGLDHLEVSLDAATAGTYLRIRQSPVFARVVDNTLKYIDAVKRVDPARTVTVSFVIQDGNRHEAADFEAFWRGRADAVYVREHHRHNGLVPASGPVAPPPADRHPCPFLFERLIVHHDGRVRFCEFDWEADHVVGDANTESLAAIWQGVNYRRLREGHVAGRFDHPFCRSCVDWPHVRWAGL